MASPIRATEEADEATGAGDPTAASNETAASGDADADRPYWRTNLFKRLFSDQKFLFTDWIGQEARRPGVALPLVAGIALAASSNGDDFSQPDLSLERRFNASVTEEHTATARAFTNLGNAGTGVVFLGAAYLIGRFGGHERLAEASSLSAEALLDTGLWTTILKRATARSRPTGGADGRFFDYQPAPGQSNESFPSGHSAGAFALATVFSGLYGEDHRWVSWVAYGAAGLVGLSRVGLGRHFTSDVIVGGLIGNSFGRMVLSRRDGGRSEHRIQATFAPGFDPVTRTAEVGLTLRWGAAPHVAADNDGATPAAMTLSAAARSGPE